MDDIQLSFDLNVGNAAVDDDPSNPLSRALRVSMEEGRPHQAHALCFYQGDPGRRSSHQTIRWLGVFILSAAHRVLFFPGLATPPTWIETTSEGSTAPRRSFDLDHISLEPSNLRWHFTSPGSAGHLAGGRTPDLGQGRLAWFGLSLQSEEVLREVSSTTVASFSCPPQDTERRMSHLSKTQSMAAHNLVGLTEANKGRLTPGFPHFCFTALLKSPRQYAGPDWLFPGGSPSLIDPLPDRIPEFEVRMHRIRFGGSYDIQVTCMWLPGRIAVPGVWTTHHHV